MVLLDLEDVWTEVLPGLPLPAGAANFVFAWKEWMRNGEIGVFNVESPSSWDFGELCTLALLVANGETSAARLMVSNMMQSSTNLLPSATLMTQNNNFLLQNPFRRKRAKKKKCAFYVFMRYKQCFCQMCFPIQQNAEINIWI